MVNPRFEVWAGISVSVKTGDGNTDKTVETKCFDAPSMPIEYIMKDAAGILHWRIS